MKVLSSSIAIAAVAIAAVAAEAWDPSALAGEFDAFEQLLRSGDCSTCAMPAANLRGADLSYMQLSAADLQGAKLYSGGPIPASLEGANLAAADLRQADLRRVNLRGALLSDTDLVGANLFGADLSGANLTGADLRGVNLEGSIGLPDAGYDNVDREGDRSDTIESSSFERAPLARRDGTIVAASELPILRLSTSSDRLEADAILENATYDEMTHFPPGFDPVAAGMQFVPMRLATQLESD